LAAIIYHKIIYKIYKNKYPQDLGNALPSVPCYHLFSTKGHRSALIGSGELEANLRLYVRTTSGHGNGATGKKIGVEREMAG
jgi:hypothetical protein